MAEIKVAEAKERLLNLDEVYCAYCRHTRMPYVCEGPDYTDRVFLFEKEDACRGFALAKQTEMIPIMGTRFEKKDFNKLFVTILYSGADTLIFQTGQEPLGFSMDAIARIPDQNQIDEAKRPLINPGLQLSALYFLQEARRPAKWQNKEKLNEMGEEVMVNLKRSDFLVPVSFSEGDPTKVMMNFMKTKDDKMIQPLFSDMLELEKFSGGKPVKASRVSFEKLKGLLLADSVGFILNPLGFAYPMERPLLDKLAAME